ncbi:NAD(P)-dependent oxidoreductase [Hymenobacter sp. H14-R3]|uniref:NAD(P)-dependent oxidoreductase n=1 Tax=Hymenobacter sp. H14-R3 TaxID=3046308 RepID=UPI0024B8A54B|nr:NAD(P)-dependent oxidoreductase [Hymenobacter sp. H14-R3]MDJ0365947.1 NAD(P)-dependent oxidoreductase [Hymenobacter sp. H14-R3]
MADKIAFLGLGSMGAAMAANLLKAGFPLTVYNRTAAKAEPLREQGAAVAATPAEAVRDATIVFTMLTDDQALEEITTGPDGILSALPEGAIHASCSTVAPDTNRRLAEAHAAHGSVLVASPVFGKPDVAALGKLWVGCSGPAEARERLQAALAAIGRGTHDFGDDPGAASVAKLCGNFLLGTVIEGMAEALTLAEKSGLDRVGFYNMLTTTLFDNPIYKGYGKLIAEQHYQPVGAPPAIIRKDMNLVVQEAYKQAVPMPFANIIRDRLTATVARAEPDVDWASFAQRVSEDAGLGK